MDWISTRNIINYRRNITEDFAMNVFSVNSYSRGRYDVEVPDGQKAGPTLLCSGIFLGLVGTTFTVMAWINYESSTVLQWTQLLGPVILCIGVAFILIGVCKMTKSKCKFWIVNDDQPLELDHTTSRQPFVFTGINQPITFHGATVVQYIPPPYGIGTNDSTMVASAQPSGSELPGFSMSTCPPQYCTIFPLDRPPYPGDHNDTQSISVDGGNLRAYDCSGIQRGINVNETSSSAPPAYEDIFPNQPSSRTN